MEGSYTWIVFICFTFLNAFYFRYKSKEAIKDTPELKEGFEKIFKAIIIWGNIPWVILLLSQLFQPELPAYSIFFPKFNIFNILFQAYKYVLWITLAYWIYIKKGADFIYKHRMALYKMEWTTPAAIKILIGLSLIGGLIGEYHIWKQILTQ